MNTTQINLLFKIEVFWDVLPYGRSYVLFEVYDGAFILRLKRSTRLNFPEDEFSPTPL